MKNFLIVLTIIPLFFSGCSKSKIEEKETAEKVKEVRVSAVAAKKENYTPEVSFGGTFKPNREANLSAHMPGRIKKIHYREGSKVSKDALLVTLSDDMARAVKAELDAVEKDYSRVKELVEKKVVPAQQLDHIQAKLDATKAKYDMMNENIEIHAPFNGVVAEHMMKEGEEFILLNPGLTPGFSHSSGIIRFMDIDRLLIEIEVGEKEYPAVKKMKSVNVTAEAYPDKILKGKFYSEESLVSTLSRTVKMSIEVSNPGNMIKPGMFGRVEIILPGTQAVLIPRFAVMRQSGSEMRYVFTEKNGRVSEKNIMIIDDLGDYYAVTGLTDGEKVITDGKTKLSDGMEVIVSESTGEEK